MKKVNHWINGKNVAGNDYFQTTNPATGEVLADVASGGEAEINQAVATAKEAFPKWANLPMKERARLMRRLGDLIDQNVPEIAAMETADTGLPIHQTKNVLIPRASHNFEFFAEVCQQMNGKTYPVDDKMLNYTLVQPVGVCALVSPWNVPFMTATWKVAPCLALGNTAVLKMSELSPLTADRLGELALEAGIPAGVLNVVQGYGATAGDALVRHHDVRAVSFTGGTATGRNIMKNAGLKKYSMELGGKSPVLIFEDADIERAGRRPVHHLLDQRRALHRRFAHLYSTKHLPGIRETLCRTRQPSARGRSDRSEYPGWGAYQPATLGKSLRLYPSGH